MDTKFCKKVPRGYALPHLRNHSYLVPNMKGLKMLLSSDGELKWKQNGSSFEYWGFIWKTL